MKLIISILAIASFLSCGHHDARPTEAGEIKKIDSPVVQNVPVDTPKTVAPVAQSKEQLWDEFWKQFSDVVNKRNKQGMIELSLQTKDFFDGGGGGSAAEWIHSADDETWKYWQKAIKLGTKPFEKTMRVTKNNYMMFDLKDGKWVWIGVEGD